MEANRVRPLSRSLISTRRSLGLSPLSFGKQDDESSAPSDALIISRISGKSSWTELVAAALLSTQPRICLSSLTCALLFP